MVEKDNHLKQIITGFVLVLLAVAFVVAISDQTNKVTSKTQVVNETQLASSCWARVNESAPTVNGPIYAEVDERAGRFTNSSCNITVTNAPTGWKQEDCGLSSVVVMQNGNSTTLTLNTDYVLNANTGLVSLMNTTATKHWLNTSNNTLVTYSYCGDGYVNSSWGRSILGVNTGIFAIAILIIVLILVTVLLGKRDDD